MVIIKGKKCDNFTQAINQPRPTDSNIIDCVKEQIKNWNTNNGNNKIENTSYPTSLNKEEILILAAIIEKEAGNDNAKNKIAGVFLFYDRIMLRPH